MGDGFWALPNCRQHTCPEREHTCERERHAPSAPSSCPPACLIRGTHVGTWHISDRPAWGSKPRSPEDPASPEWHKCCWTTELAPFALFLSFLVSVIYLFCESREKQTSTLTGCPAGLLHTASRDHGTWAPHRQGMGTTPGPSTCTRDGVAVRCRRTRAGLSTRRQTG